MENKYDICNIFNFIDYLFHDIIPITFSPIPITHASIFLKHDVNQFQLQFQNWNWHFNYNVIDSKPDLN